MEVGIRTVEFDKTWTSFLDHILHTTSEHLALVGSFLLDSFEAIGSAEKKMFLKFIEIHCLSILTDNLKSSELIKPDQILRSGVLEDAK